LWFQVRAKSYRGSRAGQMGSIRIEITVVKACRCVVFYFLDH